MLELTFATYLATSDALPREREQELALRRLYTSASETWTTKEAATLPWKTTGDIISSDGGLAAFVAGTAQLIQKFGEMLPPVDHESEARIDAVMARVYEREVRTPILRRRG